MNRFAALLDRLAYEPRRNGKIRLIADYFAHTPDPERGFALAALTGALSFRNAKPGLIRQLISERTDPVLFALSYDYVGDLSETVALMWPAPHGLNDTEPPPLSAIVHAFTHMGKAELPSVLASLLDRLDETGRWALLKLITGGLRIGVSARLAKTAVAALGERTPDEIELVWPGLEPPYEALFAWAGGPRRAAGDRRPRAVPSGDAVASAGGHGLRKPRPRRSSAPSGNGTASASRRCGAPARMGATSPGSTAAPARTSPAPSPTLPAHSPSTGRWTANC